MPRRDPNPDPRRDPNSLLNVAHGETARYSLEQLGRSERGKIQQNSEQIDRLKRHLVHALDLPLGFRLGDIGQIVNFDPETGRVRLHSTRGTITVTRDPNGAIDTIIIDVDEGSLDPSQLCWECADVVEPVADCLIPILRDKGEGAGCEVRYLQAYSATPSGGVGP